MHPGKILGNASGLFVCADKVCDSSLIIVAFWIVVIVSARIQAEDSAMSRHNSARSSWGEKVTLVGR
jgi:hypothetical protein